MPTESEKNAAFRKVTEEIRKKEIHPGPKARALAESNGNKDVARSLYIKYRAAELLEQYGVTGGLEPQPPHDSAAGTDRSESGSRQQQGAGAITLQKKIGLFSKIETRDDALKTVRDASTAFFFIAALQAALSFLSGPWALTDAALFALGGFILRRFNSRAAAVVLLLLSAGSMAVTFANRAGVNLGGGKNIVLAVIVLWISIRAVEATYKLHGRFADTLPEPPVPAATKPAETKLAKATGGDILLSLIIPGWGLLVGIIALIKREVRRAATMVTISAAMIGLLFGLQYVAQSQKSSISNATQDPSAAELTRLAEEISRQAPVAIDSETRLDGATAGPGMLLTYRFTLVNYDAAQLDRERLASDILPTIKASGCSSDDIKRMLASGLAVDYQYVSRDGTEVGRISFQPDDCSSSSP